jgi:hypothetical protein
MKERISEIPAQRSPDAPKEDAQPFVFIPDLSDDELRKLAREKLSEALQAINPRDQPELTRKLVAEVKDRLDGKPTQAIDLHQKIGIVAIVMEAAKLKSIDPLLIDSKPSNIET